ncbi:hypothetical protein ScalyP_jg11622 [Parmales sp. scaly parma]|nr:hypothetical protein ScalyP_jg11622 [Parmales sp. scaly parma]
MQSLIIPPPISLQTKSRLPSLSQIAFPPVASGYDLVVIGCGPAGETAALAAARAGKIVALLDVKKAFGGPSGLTSKAVREAATRIIAAVGQIKGDRRRLINELYESNYNDLRLRTEVLQVSATRAKLMKANVSVFIANPPQYCEECASFKIPWTANIVIDATKISTFTTLPRSVVIFGGGVVALEYATVLAKLAVGVTIIVEKGRFMPFLSSEVRNQLRKILKQNGVLLLEDVAIKSIVVDADAIVNAKRGCVVELTSGRRFPVSCFLYSGGRQANSENLGLESLTPPVKISKFGRISQINYQTANSNVYAIGDVIGPPSLASSAIKQAKSVIRDLFESESTSTSTSTSTSSATSLFGEDIPLTLWSFPQIARAGLSGEQLKAQKRTFFAGYSYFKDLSRGRLGIGRGGGDTDVGYMKLIAEPNGFGDFQVVGCEILGETANELIQTAAILIGRNTTVEEIRETAFAAVTVSESFSVAAEDVVNKMNKMM